MAASPAENAKRLEEVPKLTKSDPAKAEEIYKSILTESPGSNAISISNLEVALVGLGELYRDQQRVDELANLILQTREALSSFAKAKVAKLGVYQHFSLDISILIFAFSETIT
jgi:26S proteasome regulatory subunit N6